MSDTIILSQDEGMSEAENFFCMAALKELHHYYPGHPWCAGSQVSPTGGVVYISLMYTDHLGKLLMSGRKFLLKLDEVGTSPERWTQEIMRGGGEVLERFGLPRGPYRDGAMMDARAHGFDTTTVH